MENTTLSNISDNSTLAGLTSSSPPKVIEFIEKVFIEKIYSILLFVVGTIGNTITICVLSKKQNRNSSTGNFLLALAVSDTCILFTVPFTIWMLGMWNINLRNMSVIGCKLHIYVAYVFTGVSSWLLAQVTIERVVSVVRPYKVKGWITLKRTRLCIGFTVLLLSVFFTHFLYGYQRNDNPAIALACIETGEDYIYFLVYVYPYLDFLIIFLLPCAIIIPGNIVIIYYLAEARLRRDSMTSDRGRKVPSVTRTLVIAGVVFVVTVAPMSIFFILYSILPTIRASRWLINFLQSVLNAVASTNAAINFFLYVVSGKTFRREVKELFKCNFGGPGSGGGVFGNVRRNGSVEQESRSSVYTVDMPSSGSVCHN